MGTSLAGKVAVVTGGSSRIGLATAHRFAAEGASVFIAGRRQAELDRAVAAIGGDVTAIQADTSKLADLDRLYAAVEQQGRLDIVFASAGILEREPMGTITEASVDRILGFAMIGPEAGEVMTVVQTAMLAGVPYTGLRDAIIAHPTTTATLIVVYRRQ